MTWIRGDSSTFAKKRLFIHVRVFYSIQPCNLMQTICRTEVLLVKFPRMLAIGNLLAKTSINENYPSLRIYEVDLEALIFLALSALLNIEDIDYLADNKRPCITEDPDYCSFPSPKKLKLLEEQGQEELRERVSRVIDNQIVTAINEKNNEIDEIDLSILRLQQCLHTLRYCITLQFYSQPKSVNSRKSCNHPAVRKLSKHGNLKEEKIHDCVNNLDAITDECLSSQDDNNSNNKDNIQIDAEPKKTNSGLPSPKYIPPKSPEVVKISRFREEKFKVKRRLIVGNTYQYINAEETGFSSDALRFKWQIYVRCPEGEEDIASFVSCVTFILDRSFAPHDVISLTKSPFILSRRGWGEFKVQIILRFCNEKNKNLKLQHFLTLARDNDSLAYTGLWRLGQENWYDISLYSDNVNLHNETQTADERSISTVKNKYEDGVVCHAVEENLTYTHNAISDVPSIESSFENKCRSVKNVKENNVKKILFKKHVHSLSPTSVSANLPKVVDNNNCVGVNDNSEIKLQKMLTNIKDCTKLSTASDCSTTLPFPENLSTLRTNGNIVIPTKGINLKTVTIYKKNEKNSKIVMSLPLKSLTSIGENKTTVLPRTIKIYKTLPNVKLLVNNGSKNGVQNINNSINKTGLILKNAVCTTNSLPSAGQKPVCAQRIDSLYRIVNASSCSKVTGKLETKEYDQPSLIKASNYSQLSLVSPLVGNKTENCQILNCTKRNDDLKLKDEVLDGIEWLEHKGILCSLSKCCKSVSSLIRLWVKNLPFIVPPSWRRTLTGYPYLLSLFESYIQYPVGKQRALEFYYAKEMLKNIKSNSSIEAEFSFLSVVLWARRHAYTPTKCRPVTSLDISNFDTLNYCKNVYVTLSKLFYNFDKNIMKLKGKETESSSEEIDVISIEEENEYMKTGSSASPKVKPSCEYIAWDNEDNKYLNLHSGCSWVSTVSSQIRIPISAEEVLPNTVCDMAKAALWSAVLSLMEDLLRSSHASSWDETVHSNVASFVPPMEIKGDNVFQALASSRPEFQIFTNFGLGKDDTQH